MWIFFLEMRFFFPGNLRLFLFVLFFVALFPLLLWLNHGIPLSSSVLGVSVERAELEALWRQRDRELLGALEVVRHTEDGKVYLDLTRYSRGKMKYRYDTVAEILPTSSFSVLSSSQKQVVVSKAGKLYEGSQKFLKVEEGKVYRVSVLNDDGSVYATQEVAVPENWNKIGFVDTLSIVGGVKGVKDRSLTSDSDTLSWRGSDAAAYYGVSFFDGKTLIAEEFTVSSPLRLPWKRLLGRQEALEWEVCGYGSNGVRGECSGKAKLVMDLDVPSHVVSSPSGAYPPGAVLDMRPVDPTHRLQYRLVSSGGRSEYVSSFTPPVVPELADGEEFWVYYFLTDPQGRVGQPQRLRYTVLR